MNIQVVAVGMRMTDWVQDAWHDYARRLTHSPFHLKLITIPTAKRTKNIDSASLLKKEGEKIMAAIKQSDYVIALDERGAPWNTQTVANHLNNWQQGYHTLSFIIGGPDGLAKTCLQTANQHWSLSNLTFPHGLVRVILAEQLYRAWTILQQHPYHRE